jgi:zinc protease
VDRVGGTQGWRRGKTLALALGLASLASTAHARSPSCESVERLTLNNGVEVILKPERALPTVAIVSSVHVGSRNDPAGRAGLAHFVEHLTFREAPRFPSVFNLYTEAGATGMNATTSPDTTDYFATVPAAQLERAIWIEARRLGLGLSALSERPAEGERQVVLREHEARFGYAPETRLARAIFEALYPPGHPYHAPFATEDSLEKLTLADARWFFAEHYRPDRVRLVLLGDFEPEQAKRWIERDFGGLAPQSPVSGRAELAAAEPASVSECRWAERNLVPSRRRLRLLSRSRNQRLEFFWPVSVGEEPERARGSFNTLASELRDAAAQNGLSHRVSAELVERELSSVWRIVIDVTPGQSLEKAEGLFRAVIEELRRSSSNEPSLNADRQAIELSTRLDETRPMFRALRLVRRECAPSTCVDPAALVDVSTLSRLDRFAPEKALVVEVRYSRGASSDGEIESVQ